MPAQPSHRPGCPAADRRPLPDPALPDPALPDPALPCPALPYPAVPGPRPVRMFAIPDAAPPYDGETPPRVARPPEPRREDGNVPHPAGGAPAPAPAWPGRFAQVLAETLAGSRPPRQIAAWTTQRARDHIQRLGAQLASAQQPRVRRVITSRPASDVVEMSVVVGFGPRVRALAVRLERASPPPGAGSAPPEADRWLCTAVEAA